MPWEETLMANHERMFPWPMRVIAEGEGKTLRSITVLDEATASMIGDWQSDLVKYYSGDRDAMARHRGITVVGRNEAGDLVQIRLSTRREQLLEVEPAFRDAWRDGELSG